MAAACAVGWLLACESTAPLADQNARSNSANLSRRIDGAALQELESYISEQMSVLGVPGAALAVIENGQVIRSRGFGVRKLGANAPLTTDTRLMIGSVTKSMTTMLAAALIDEGLLRWDSPASSLMPELRLSDPEATRSLTLRDLFCNCSGVLRRDADFTFLGDTLSPAGLIASLPGLEYSPAARGTFNYSNQLVAAGGYALALAAGGTPQSVLRDYAAELEQRVWQPIELLHTTLSLPDAVASGNYASSHSFSLTSGYVVNPLRYEAGVAGIAPAGAAWSTIDDLARYALTVLRRGLAPNGQRVASEESLAPTWQPQVPIDEQGSYGMGWILSEVQGHGVVTHNGGTFGFTSLVSVIPDLGLGIVMLNNAQGADYLNYAARERLFGRYFGQPDRADELIQARLAQVEQARSHLRPAGEEAASAWLGDYTNPNLGALSLRWRGDRLVATATGFDSELQERFTDDGAVASYVAVDAPLGGALFRPGTGEGGAPTVTFSMAPPDLPEPALFVRRSASEALR